MAGRSRAAAAAPPSAGLFGRPPPQSGLFGPPPPQPHPLDPRRPLDPRAAIAALEDRLAAQGREIQDLLIDNQRLAATHVALKQELAAADRDLHLVATDSARARDDREAEVRAVYERAAKAEADARAVDAVREELDRVRSDLVKLRAVRDELGERVRGAKMEADRAKAEIAQAPELRAEIEAMHREIQRGRAAVEYEKNAHAGNMEQSQAMEANMVTLAREVEKLRAELANAEKRAATATVAANPGYNTGSYGNPEMAYGGAGYANAYSMQQAQYGSRGADGAAQYGSRGADTALQYGSGGAEGVPQYGTGVADGAALYGTGAVSRGPYEMQQAYGHR